MSAASNNAQISRVTHTHSRHDYYPSRFTFALFLLFAANTVFVLFDVPLLGLSISAIFFALVALEIVFRSDWLSFHAHARWYLPIYGIGIAVFLSLAMNGIVGRLEFGEGQLLAIIQAIFWLMVFIITMELVSRLTAADVRRLMIVLGIAIIAIGLLRLYEAVALGRTGPGTSRILTQNVYGVLFSGFTPFAVLLVIQAKNPLLRLFAICGVLLLIPAIVVNGSRSSWIASAVGVGVLVLLFMLARRHRAAPLLGIVVIVLAAGAVVVSSLPSEVLDPLSRRFATLDRVEEDKSYVIRELTQQKALILFSDNPIFGVGRGQFRYTEVDLTPVGTAFGANLPRHINSRASHNSYAQWAAELGLVGVIPYVALIALLAVNGIRSAYHLGRRGEIWALAIFTSFIAVSIHLWSIDNLQTTSTWFIYGLTAGMIEWERRTSTSPESA